MNNEVKISLTADESRLIQGLRRGETAAKTFGSSVKQVFADMHRVVDAANKTFGTFGKITAALGSGVVLKKLFSLDEFTKVDDALLMMQANLKMNARELENFKSKAADMAGGLGEDMGEIFKISSKLSKSFKPDDILKIMDASSMASHAMEQDLTGVTERIVQIMKMYRKTPEEAKSIAEAMVASNADSETLNTLLQRGILKGGAGKDYQEILAIAGALRKAGAESPRVVTAIESIMNSIEDNQSMLKAGGIDVFKIDPQTGKKVRKDITQILTELKPALDQARKRFKDDAAFNKAVDETFGPSAHEGIPFLISQIDAIKKAKEDQGNASQIAADRAAKAEEKWGEQLERIKGHLAKIKVDMSWVYDLAKKPLKFLADSPNLTKGLGYGAAGLSLAVLGGMAAGKGREFLKNYKGTAIGVAEGKALEAAAGITPVFVTNWPGGFGGAGRTDAGLGTRVIDFAKKTTPAAATLGSRILPFLTNPATLTAATLAGPAYIVSRMQQEASAGLRKWRSENPYDYAKSQEVMGGIKNDIALTVNIDGKRITTNTDDTNTKIDVKRGAFFGELNNDIGS